MNLLNHKIKQKTFIKAPIEKVFETITSSEGWDAFFTTGMELDLKSNGAMLFKWVDWGPEFYNVSEKAKVLEIKEPYLFVFEWYPVENYPTRIEMKLESKLGGTVLTLNESGYPDTEKGRNAILDCASGWSEALTLLKFYLEFNVVYTPPQKDKD
jgi:uncharacterized protein YndB with AHSA1/START domain